MSTTQAPSDTKVFVSNLPYRTNWSALKEHFSAAGNVTYARIFTDAQTKRSKGIGFVEFDTAEAAAKAITMFNESEFNARKIYVRQFQEKEKTEQVAQQ
ncbi:RRM domain-containing protein [Naegleria gruberi]|uniref:RRM domain-containing protein n=1 Tax=Naegleria gruberi TaxID=5762 RepID=D2VBQ1_NAEGR|nr:RRM domain-containing protein [Naegleria gruberi]EFC45948.1 RRM domain-containing protein [Naegleria gruberi]|eukprot:XP_002678692.1 RRM domain-containing protein [Naegleria gruberi strain NEG-M]